MDGDILQTLNAALDEVRSHEPMSLENAVRHPRVRAALVEILCERAHTRAAGQPDFCSGAAPCSACGPSADAILAVFRVRLRLPD